MEWGMQNRLARIRNPRSGRCVMLAVDHGYFQGPTTGLENLGKTVEPLLPYADSLMITRGALRNWISPEIDKPIVLRVSGGQSILKELSNEIITTSIEGKHVPGHTAPDHLNFDLTPHYLHPDSAVFSPSKWQDSNSAIRPVLIPWT